MINEKKGNDFKPYIPSDKIISELTPTSIILGVILAVVFGGANAYLGLRVGMTISSSIPAAVISMGLVRIVLRRDSVLENNMVQTIGSAGESLAAGAIFTMPVWFLWAREGKTEEPVLATMTTLALIGGLLGVLFMVPLRNALIVKEHWVLNYPEGTACARVLLAGEKKQNGSGSVFAGIGVAAIIKFIIDGLKIVPSAIKIRLTGLNTRISTEVYPALLSVGYICGLKVASYLFAGGIISWLVIIPLIAEFSANPMTPDYIWSNYIRYIGAGAVAAGGIISLVKTFPVIISTFKTNLFNTGKKGTGEIERTNRDLSTGAIISGVIILAAMMWILPYIPISLPGALLVIVFGFLFATVSSRMVGMVGSSNNPVSGMAIATLLVAATLLRITGNTGIKGMLSAIAIGSIICIVAAMAGDTSQDLKTGYILGATPKKQQIGEIIGIVVSAFTIGGVLFLLDKAWGFGSEELSAPQATLMKVVVEGVMDKKLPWALVLTGVFIAIAMELVGVMVLPVAIGIYLPLELTAPIMAGGIIRALADSGKKNTDRGILFCSGLIAGEGLIGIILAICAITGVSGRLDMSGSLYLGNAGEYLLLLIISLLIYYFAVGGKRNEK